MLTSEDDRAEHRTERAKGSVAGQTARIAAYSFEFIGMFKLSSHEY
jgi:hypothetical protein